MASNFNAVGSDHAGYGLKLTIMKDLVDGLSALASPATAFGSLRRLSWRADAVSVVQMDFHSRNNERQGFPQHVNGRS